MLRQAPVGDFAVGDLASARRGAPGDCRCSHALPRQLRVQERSCCTQRGLSGAGASRVYSTWARAPAACARAPANGHVGACQQRHAAGSGAYAWDEAGRRCRREPALLWRSSAHATHPRRSPPDLAPPSHPPSTGATRLVMGGGPTILCSCGCRMAAGAPPPSSSASMSPPQPRRHGCRCGSAPRKAVPCLRACSMW